MLIVATNYSTQIKIQIIWLLDVRSIHDGEKVNTTAARNKKYDRVVQSKLFFLFLYCPNISIENLQIKLLISAETKIVNNSIQILPSPIFTIPINSI